MSLPRYSRYKDSGSEWLGTIPDQWKVSRLKCVCRIFPSNVDKKSYDDQDGVKLCNYVDVYYNDEITDDLPFMDATASLDQIDKFTLTERDTIITKDSETPDDIAVAAYVPRNLPGVICGYHLAIVRPGQAMVGRYVKRLFDSHFLKAQFAVAAKGLTRYGLSQYAIDNALVTVPPLGEQADIAAFLDRETGKIDALVAEQEKLIELLKEKRQAVISHAVTKGLDPTAPMKDSGIEWLGKVPAHWTMKRLKHISPQLTVGIVVNPSSYIADDGLPFLYGGDISEGRIDYQDARRIDLTSSEQNKKTQLRTGDIVTVRVGAPGVSAVVPPECNGGNCASVMLIRSGDFVSDWLCHAMNSRMVRYQVEIVQYGAAQEQFNISHAVDFWVATPPRAEQQHIADFLEQASSAINGLISEAGHAIDLLKEHRSALISAAVTGKIDVRGLVDTKPPTRSLEPA